MTCPWCGVDGYDNVIFLPFDPEHRPRCGNCLNDVRTEFIERFVPREAVKAEREWWASRVRDLRRGNDPARARAIDEMNARLDEGQLW